MANDIRFKTAKPSDSDDSAVPPEAAVPASAEVVGVVVPIPPAEAVDLPPTMEYAIPAMGKIWTVGTLVYTVGGLCILFFWLLLGDFALNLRDRSVGPTVQLFLKREGASDTVMALLLSSIPPFLGMIIGPIVSYRSDRLRSRWGRRIPFLIIPTPIAAVAMVGIAFCPQFGDALERLLGHRYSNTACTIAIFGVFWTVFEVAAIVSASVFGGLINDVVPRPVLGRFYGLFRAVSLIDGMIFNYLLIGKAESHLPLMFIGIATVFGVGFVVMCLMVKEGDYPPPHEILPPPQLAGTRPLPSDAKVVAPEVPGFANSVARYFRECYSHPHYLWCFAAFTFGSIAFLPVNVFSIPYAKSVDMDMDHYGKLIGSSYLISLILAYPLGSMVDRYHSVRVGLVALTLYAASTLWGATCIRDANTFGIALVIHTVLSGTYFTATASLGQALLPRSKFGQFASAGSVLTALVSMTVGPVLGGMLDTTGHNYRLTFVAGFILSCVAALVMFVVYRRFMQMGGPTGYIAPGDTLEDLVAPVPSRGH